MISLLLLACASIPLSADNREETSALAIEAKGETESRCPPMVDGFRLPRAVYPDADGDGFGDSSERHRSCWLPRWYVEVGGDCDDADASVNDGCGDTGTDTGSGGIDTGVFPVDADGDGWYLDGGDCDDGDPAVNPAAPETGNRIDDDCDGTADENLGIIVTNDGSGGFTVPGTLWAWFGSGGSATEFMESEGEFFAFSPNATDIADHPWASMQASWNQTSETSWSSWSGDCTGFQATSSDHTVALYQDPTLTDPHCYVVIDGGTLTGDKAGFVEYLAE